MDFLKQNKLMIGAGLVVALAAGVYFMYFSGGGGAPALTTTSGTTGAVSQDLLTELQSLHTIKLDNSIFQNPVFVSLTDFGVMIPPENSGRPNPFLSVTGASAPSKQSPALKLPATKPAGK